MHFQTASNDQKLATIRAHIVKSQKTIGFPTNTSMVRWLAEQYAKLPGALRSRAISEAPLRRFDSLTPQEKLDWLHNEMAQAEAMDHSNPTVPTPWAAWLLTEFDRLTGANTTDMPVRAG